MNYFKRDLTVPIFGTVGNLERTFQDGINKTDPAHKIGNKQVRDSLNVYLDINKRRLACKALNHALDEDVRGLWDYLQTDGTDRILQVQTGKLNEISKTSPYGVTQRYDMTGSGEAWFTNYLNKCWVCNGSANVKVEGANAYQIGITAPSGVIAAASSGGDLPDGDYQLYACYARKVSSTNVLYSQGQNLGTVTCGSGNNRIAVTNFLDSSDSQVTTKVIFMSDAGGSVYYYWAEVQNGTDTITISDTAGKNSAIVYATIASDNTVPSAFEYIYSFDKRIWGSITDTLYYSLQAGTVYDLERFESLAYITYPYEINGIYSLGEHLYVSTPNGMIKQPYGDVSARFEQKDQRFYFKYPRTVIEYRGMLIGLTQDGVRAFDGEKFGPDMTRDIKDEMKIAYSGWGDGNRPCGHFYRRGHREEYHLCYKDNSVDTRTNNKRYVLNLDRFSIREDGSARAPWECWNNSCNYMATDINNTLYHLQRGIGDGVLFVEREDRMLDENIYINGTKQTAGLAPKLEITSATFIPDISALMSFLQCRVFANHQKNYTITIYASSYPRTIENKTVSPPSGGFVLGVSLLGVGQFSTTDPIPQELKLGRNLRGKSVYVLIEQEAQEDQTWEMLELYLTGHIRRSRYT